jgi:peptidoglycan/LPS O-acetylase OafA/YrhL
MKFSGTQTLDSAIQTHDNGFNLVRLVAALLVVWYHAYQLNTANNITLDPISGMVAPLTNLGSIAVGIFFMVSGLFVAQSWLRDPNVVRFILRRIARIVPGLLICLLLTTTVAVSFFSDAGWRGLLTPAPWQYIFHNTALHGLRYIIPPEHLFLPGVLSGQALNGPLWTLYWEARMYIVLALIGCSAIIPMREWIRGTALFLLLAANLIPQVMVGYLWEVQLWSLFLVGVLLTTFATQVRIGPVQVACAAALIALNWTRSLATTPSGFTWFGIALAGCALALWVGTSRPKGCSHLQHHDYSLGIYIYHWPVLLMLRAALPPMGGPALFAATLLAVVPTAMLSWHLIEAPALKFSRARLRA